MGTSRRWFVRLLAVVILAATTGCTKKRAEDFTPTSSDGRAALEVALRSWKEGKSPGMVEGVSKPAIQAEDSEWKAGQKLLEYEIVKDEPPTEADRARVFTVRIKTDQGQREVKYMVVGIDPVLVFRDAEFKKLSGTGGP